MTWTDRLRIERFVWTLDMLVQSLPGRSRKAMRREMRANLRASATEVGAREAVRRLGPIRPLAVGYLEAEYGEGRPRPHWLQAVFWGVGLELLVLALTIAGHTAFVSGVEAGNRHPNGTYAWHDLSWLGISGDVSYADGQFDGFSVRLSVWVLVYVMVACVLGGRLWRLLPPWWRTWRRRGEVTRTP